MISRRKAFWESCETKIKQLWFYWKTMCVNLFFFSVHNKIAPVVKRRRHWYITLSTLHLNLVQFPQLSVCLLCNQNPLYPTNWLETKKHLFVALLLFLFSTKAWGEQKNRGMTHKSLCILISTQKASNKRLTFTPCFEGTCSFKVKVFMPDKQ